MLLSRPNFLNGKSQGFLLALAANVLWGTSFLASKHTLAVWGPFTASALRFTLALLVMAVAFPALGFRIRAPKTFEVWAGIALLALTGFGALYPRLQISHGRIQNHSNRQRRIYAKMESRLPYEIFFIQAWCRWSAQWYPRTSTQL